MSSFYCHHGLHIPYALTSPHARLLLFDKLNLAVVVRGHVRPELLVAFTRIQLAVCIEHFDVSAFAANCDPCFREKPVMPSKEIEVEQPPRPAVTCTKRIVSYPSANFVIRSVVMINLDELPSDAPALFFVVFASEKPLDDFVREHG